MPKAEQGGDNCHVIPLARFFIFGVQNLRRIKQRKGHYFIQASSADENDKDGEYDSEFFCLSFLKRNAQNLHHIKQRKGHCFTQAPSDDEDYNDDEN